MNELKSRISKLNALITRGEIKANTNGDPNFHVFDYDPKERYKVNNYIYNFIYENNKEKILIIDIYKTIIEILEKFDYIDFLIEEEKTNGIVYVNKIIQDVLGLGTQKKDLLKKNILEKIEQNNGKIIFLIGLEGCSQIIRGQTIQSILVSNVTENPIIMFYPGTYDK